MFLLSKFYTMMVSFFKRVDNPHEVTASQMGTYSKAEADELFNRNLSPGMLPVSRYGTLSWLPVNVSGSFEGATRNESYWRNVILEEQDGTPVLLVNSTNGITASAYYSYLQLNDQMDVINHVPTGTEYRPAFLANANARVLHVLHSAARGVVWGEVQGNRDLGTHFVALTKGTLNDKVHIGAFFTPPDGVTLYTCAVLSGDYVYLFTSARNGQIIIVSRCPAADIQNNQQVEFTRLADWKTTGTNKTYTAENIQIGGVWSSTNVADDPVIVVDSSWNSETWVPWDGTGVHVFGDKFPSGNKIRLSLGADLQVTYAGIVNNANWGLSIVIDPDAKTAVVDPDYRGITTIVKVDAQPGFRIDGPLGTTLLDLWMGASQPHETMYVSDTGTLYRVHYSNEGPGTIRTAVDQNFTTPANFWDWKTRSMRYNTNRQFRRYYPSIVGDQARALNFLDRKTYCWYSNTNGSTIFNTQGVYGKTVVPGGFTHEYETWSQGNMMGYPPEERTSAAFLANYSPWIQVCDEKGDIRAEGAVLFDGRLTGYVTLDVNGNTTGSVSVTLAQHDALKNDIIATLPEGWWEPNSTTRLELYIFQDTALPPLCYFTAWLGETKRVVIYFASLNVSSRNGAIASLSIKKMLRQSMDSGLTLAINNKGLADICCPWVFHNKAEGFYLVGINPKFRRRQSSSEPSAQFAISIKHGEQDYSGEIFRSGTVQNWYFGTNQWGVVPELGVGMYNMSAARSMSGAAMIFQALGKTWAELTAWQLKPEKYVIISQQVAAGWNLYFTESTPWLANGTYYDVPPATINLTTITANPANKTFYVYIVLVDGVPEYQLMLTPVAVSGVKMYLGYLRTNETQMVETKVVKTTYIGNLCLSGLKVGSAIPISSGLPSEPADFPW